MALNKSQEAGIIELETVPTDSVSISEEDYRLRIHTILAILALSIAFSCSSIASVGPGTTISQVTIDLGNPKVQSWIANVALLPLIGFHPIWGQLSDRFGKKWFIVAGCASGVIGNVVAGNASKTIVVIGGQALNGMGSSLVLLGIPACLEITPAKYRPYTMACMTVINNILSIVTQLTAGTFANMSTHGWRWVYHYNAIFFGLGGLGVAFFYYPPPTKLRRENTISDELKSVDFPGIGLLLSGVVLLITALTWGGNSYPWQSAQVLSTLIIGSTLIILFCLWETFGPKHGLIDTRFLETRNFLLLLSTVFVDGALLYGISTYFPIETGAIFATDPFQTNINLLPYTMLLMVGCLVPAWLLGKKGHYRTYLVCSLVVISLFCGLLALVTPSRHAMALVFLGVIGFGSGGPSLLPVVLVSYSVPEFLLGTASTVLTSIRALGGVIGITIFTAIYSNALSKNLPTAVAAAAVGAGLPNSSLAEFLAAFLGTDKSLLPSIKGVTTQLLAACTDAMKSASAASFRNVWFVNMAFGLLAAIMSLFLLPVKDRMTNHIESALEPGELREAQFQISADMAHKAVNAN